MNNTSYFKPLSDTSPILGILYKTVKIFDKHQKEVEEKEARIRKLNKLISKWR